MISDVEPSLIRMISGGDVEVEQLGEEEKPEDVVPSSDNMLGEITLEEWCRRPLPPEVVASNTGQEIRYFCSPKQGFHNWFHARFILMSHEFDTVEQYTCWQKARFFGDHEMAVQLLWCRDPVKARRLAQRLRGFRHDQWNDVRDKVSGGDRDRNSNWARQIAFEGMRAKFSQNELLFKQLRDTGTALIADASYPLNPHWTCGENPKNVERFKNTQIWSGENMSGHLLMRLRDHLNKRIFWSVHHIDVNNILFRNNNIIVHTCVFPMLHKLFEKHLVFLVRCVSL